MRKTDVLSPDAVEDTAVGKNADVHIGHDDGVEMPLSFIREEQIGHPHFVRIGQRQIFDFTYRPKPPALVYGVGFFSVQDVRKKNK